MAARCHDHKYDPISQADYYGLQSLFAASEAKPLNTGAGVAQVLTRRNKPEPVQVLLGAARSMRRSALAVPMIFRSLPGGKVLDGADANEAGKSRSDFGEMARCA